MIEKYPTTKVLIVEGEKAAQAASKLFSKEEMICITWSEGANSVSKMNWTSLFRREVIVWPDNDKAGFEAGLNACKHLRQGGVKSLKIVDTDLLSKTSPPRWDLADQLPEGIDDKIILRAQPKALDIEKLKQINPNADLKELIKLNDILWRVDNRLRNDLEKHYPNDYGKIDSELLKEVSSVLEEAKTAKFGVLEEFKDIVAHKYSIDRAETGSILTEKDVFNLENQFKDFIMSLNPQTTRNSIDSFVLTQIFCDSNYSKKDFNAIFEEKKMQLSNLNEKNKSVLFKNDPEIKSNEINK